MLRSNRRAMSKPAALDALLAHINAKIDGAEMALRLRKLNPESNVQLFY